MALEPATMAPLGGPYNIDELRMWVSDTRKAAGSTFQVVRLGDLFDELLFGTAEKFIPLVGTVLDAEKQYRTRIDLVTDLSLSIINLPNGKMMLIYVVPIKKDAKLLIDGYQVVIDAVKPTMVIAMQTKDDLDNTGRGLFIASQASDTIEPPKILDEPKSGTYLVGDVAEVISTAIGYKNLIAIKNGETLEGIRAAALPVPIEPGTADIYQFGFVHPENEDLITWSKPAVIRAGEAMAPKFISQSQSQSVDAGTELLLNANVIGTPPPLIQWIDRVNGADGDVLATGNQLKLSVLYTKTVVPVAVNSYKVDADDKFDPAGELKDFPVRGSEIVITPIKQPQPAPNNFAAYNDTTDEITLAPLLPGKVLSDYRVVIDDDEPVIPTSLVVSIGDRDVPVGKVEAYYKETALYNESPRVVSTAPFNKIPSLQPLAVSPPNALVANLVQSVIGGNRYISKGTGNTNGQHWEDCIVQINRKRAAGTKVYIDCDIEVGVTRDFYCGLKKTPELGAIEDLDAAIGISEFGQIAFQSKALGNRGIGSLVTGDKFRMYILENNLVKCTYDRPSENMVDIDIPLPEPVYFVGAGFMVINHREDTPAKSKNVNTFGLSAV